LGQMSLEKIVSTRRGPGFNRGFSFSFSKTRGGGTMGKKAYPASIQGVGTSLQGKKDLIGQGVAYKGRGVPARFRREVLGPWSSPKKPCWGFQFNGGT